MALIDDLKVLEELHSKDRLTDQEFAAAKAAAIHIATKTYPQAAARPLPAVSPALEGKKKTRLWPRIILLVVLLALIWFYVRPRLNQPAASALTGIVHIPVDLRTETFTIPAKGWKAVAIEVPYIGSLTIEAQVLGQGNAVEMFLTDQRGLEKLRSSGEGTYIAGFYAVKSLYFEHTEQMNEGTYYFVVRDKHLGVFSATASNVSLKARVDP